MFTRFRMAKSQLLMGGVPNVLRESVARAPGPVWMYWAFGLLAMYATVSPAEFSSGVTRVEVPTTPFGLMIARSGAESPFRLESALLCTVAYSGDWKV